MEKFDWLALKPQPVIGVDEVGRGCLAGPVYAAAVIIRQDFPYQHFTDSKVLSAKRREELSLEIKSHHMAALGFASVDEIEKINILQASLLAMKRAIENLGVKSGHVLVDGHQKIPGLPMGLAQSTLIKGDLRAEPVAAASIVAKVARDFLMVQLDEKYPGYGFAKHKGYGTSDHREAIAQLGPTDQHRRLFAGVKEHLTRQRQAPAAGPTL